MKQFSAFVSALMLGTSLPALAQYSNVPPGEIIGNPETTTRSAQPATLDEFGIYPYVVDNTALKAKASTSATYVVRMAFAGNASPSPVTYQSSTSACSLNSGAGDDGSQVQSSDGKCWLAIFPASGAPLSAWGGDRTGTTDATTKVQAAITALQNTGIKLLVDGRFLISNVLTAVGIIEIAGSTAPVSIYSQNCPAGSTGFTVNSNINLLRATGATGSIHDLCLQMATAPGTRTSGAAINVGATAGTQQGHFQVYRNSVINPYDGILVGGATDGTTQTNSDHVYDNMVTRPSHIGVAIGQNSTKASTVGTIIRDNQIACASGSNTNAIGVAFYDGAVTYYGGDGGPYLCNIGMQIMPGINQTVLGAFSDVLGDSSLTHDLLIDTSDSTATIVYARFIGTWAGSITATDNPVLIKSTGNGKVNNILFSGHVSHSGPAQTVPIIDIQAGTNVTFTNSTACADGGGTNTGPGIRLGLAARNTIITNNQINTCYGNLTTGVQVVNSGGVGTDVFTIADNNFGNTTTPISYTPAGETAVIHDNIGTTAICPVVASASAISIPNAAACVHVSGTISVTQILNSHWINRQLTLIADNGLTLSTGGGSFGFCGVNKTFTAGAMARVQWNSVANCWAVL